MYYILCELYMQKTQIKYLLKIFNPLLYQHQTLNWSHHTNSFTAIDLAS